jgi:hypothetical protein
MRGHPRVWIRTLVRRMRTLRSPVTDVALRSPTSGSQTSPRQPPSSACRLSKEDRCVQDDDSTRRAPEEAAAEAAVGSAH